MSPQEIIGHYRIRAKLGEGGMGVVWRATDTRLNRDVAIKVLPSALANDAQYMTRFEREAQTLAALNHPNIAAIYGIEQGAIVMELVEGEDLRGPLPVDVALGYAKQIAAGLEAAHEKGIVHRDLKPANIKITSDGVVKLLDFGLAKPTEQTAVPNGANSPTISLTMTQVGMILGTAAYMSPEQARGKPVDKRADIWAFGVVLYEMLTGKALYGDGETVTDTIAAVVTRQPDWNALPVDTPPHIRKLIARCLRKDPKLRLRDIGEARIALDEAPAVAAPPAATKRSWAPWAVAAILTLTSGLLGRRFAPRSDTPQPPIRIDTDLGRQPTIAGALALSRDGSRIVLNLPDKDGKLRLLTRLLQQKQLTPLAGTEDAQQPFFSPDGRWVGFGTHGSLWKVPVDGGPPIALCDAPTLRGASWGDDDQIVFALLGSGLFRVPASGGKPSALTTLAAGERSHRWPQVLPGSRAVLFTSATASVVYEDAGIEVLDIASGRRKPLRRGVAARFVALPDGGGKLLVIQRTNLFAMPFDPAALELRGDPVPVAQEVRSNPVSGGDFAAAPGVLIFVRSPIGDLMTDIRWVDPSGRTQPILTAPSAYGIPRLSPDGKRISYVAPAGGGFAAWVKDLDRDSPSRVTFLEGSTTSAFWAPDGVHLVVNQLGPAPGIYWIRADGAGQPVRLTKGDKGEYVTSVAPDGRRIAIGHLGVDRSFDISTAPLEGDLASPRLGPWEPFVATPATEPQAEFSFDGRWIAYASDESGTAELYVKPFPGPGGRWQISSGGGGYARWKRNGELLYGRVDGQLVALSYSVHGDSFVAGTARVWSEQPALAFGLLGRLPMWDAEPNGKRIIAAVPISGASPYGITYLLNFHFDAPRSSAK